MKYLISILIILGATACYEHDTPAYIACQQRGSDWRFVDTLAGPYNWGDYSSGVTAHRACVHMDSVAYVNASPKFAHMKAEPYPGVTVNKKK